MGPIRFMGPPCAWPDCRVSSRLGRYGAQTGRSTSVFDVAGHRAERRHALPRGPGPVRAHAGVGPAWPRTRQVVFVIASRGRSDAFMEAWRGRAFIPVPRRGVSSESPRTGRNTKAHGNALVVAQNSVVARPGQARPGQARRGPASGRSRLEPGLALPGKTFHFTPREAWNPASAKMRKPGNFRFQRRDFLSFFLIAQTDTKVTARASRSIDRPLLAWPIRPFDEDAHE